jgi:hypothetical protein
LTQTKSRPGSPARTGSQAEAATTATIAAPIVRRRADRRQVQRRNQPPLALASVFAPHGRRTWWWYTYACRTCAAHHFGRAPELDQVTGRRKAGCGHLVQIVAARVYGRPDGAVA